MRHPRQRRENPRINLVRNSSGAGAVPGTPGTLPTNWPTFGTVAGISCAVVALTTENGVDVLEVRISGTAGASASFFCAWDSNTGIPAINGKLLTSSVFIKGTANSGSVPQVGMSVSLRDSGGASLSDLAAAAAATPTTLTRLPPHTITTNNASTAFVVPRVFFVLNNAQVYDFNVRIGLPQLEPGAIATTPIRQ